MILIYTNKLTNRIKFIFNLIFRELLNTEFELTVSGDEYEAFDGIKFSFLQKPEFPGLFFGAANLLFERGIQHKDLTFIEYEGLPAFFPVYTKESEMPFDPFAAAFYLVSRYEEYLPYRKDEYDRFSVGECMAYQRGFLQKPLVNIWAIKIGEAIKRKFPSFSWSLSPYQYVPTIDIDAAWAYQQKGFFRSLGGLANMLLKLDISDFAERIKVLTNLQKDPFDTYDFQLKLQKKYKLHPIYFILFAEYGFNDKNIPVQNRKFQTLIKSLADYAEVGIHPSYNSNIYPKKLKKEISGLSKVLNREVTKSRQHFLKLQLPVTYRNLINLDITDDYTMGFAAQPGFRAGICSSFNFYDLDTDAQTKLRIHPFTIMDGTLRDYMNITSGEAMSVINPLIDEVKAVNGTFISLWHNESMSDAKRWKGWNSIYEEMIQKALP